MLSLLVLCLAVPPALLVAAAPSQACPVLGPTFTSNFDLKQTQAFQNASTIFPQSIQSLLSRGVIDNSTSTIAIDVFSTSTNASIFSYYHAGPGTNESLSKGVIDEDTVFRIGSVSKLFTAYSILVKAGLGILNDPITDHLPELAGNSKDQPLDRIVWEDVTVGALMSQMAGSGGFFTDATSCVNDTIPGCSVEDFLQEWRLHKRPVIHPFQTAIYSDSGFGILGRVLERLTGLPYNNAVQSVLGQSLGLDTLSTFKPNGTDFNGVVVPGSAAESSWGFDNQITAPSGGIYLSTADLRKTALSIMNYDLLAETTTRTWMKPRSHTASLVTSVGAPWEIIRLALPVSPTSAHTRISDLYTKVGGQAGYGTVLALSPDHGIGFSVMVAGPAALTDRYVLRDAVGTAFLIAAEWGAVENAAINFAGEFVQANDTSTNLTLVVDPEEPGLEIKSIMAGGLDLTVQAVYPGAGLTPADAIINLYPVGLREVSRSTATGTTSKVVRQSYRATINVKTPERTGAVYDAPGEGFLTGFLDDEECNVWESVDFISSPDYYGYDEFVLETEEGLLTCIEHPSTGTTLVRKG